MIIEVQCIFENNIAKRTVPISLRTKLQQNGNFDEMNCCSLPDLVRGKAKNNAVALLLRYFDANRFQA